jgi:type IV pilus assembly protein PilN
MIRINLLPHREMGREKRKKDFVALSLLTVVAGAAIALAVAFAISGQIDAQQARNNFIKAENDKLDAQIKEIALLRQEIEALRARQEAVETLQSNRTLPVHVMDELVKHTPEGIHFKRFKQENRKVTLTGLAQSNERVSNLLRNLAHETPWLERPELVEIKAVTLGKPDSKDERRAYEFSLSTTIRSSNTAAEPEKPVRPVTSAPAPAVPAPVASASNASR